MGDAALDFVLEAGPRTLWILPPERRLALAKSSQHGAYWEALRLMAAQEVAYMHAEIDFVCKRIAATDWQATRAFIPYCQIPITAREKMRDIYGPDCWDDNDFLEDFLDHHPGLRIKVKRGIHGQEYGGHR